MGADGGLVFAEVYEAADVPRVMQLLAWLGISPWRGSRDGENANHEWLIQNPMPYNVIHMAYGTDITAVVEWELDRLWEALDTLRDWAECVDAARPEAVTFQDLRIDWETSPDPWTLPDFEFCEPLFWRSEPLFSGFSGEPWVEGSPFWAMPVLDLCAELRRCVTRIWKVQTWT